MPELVGNDRGHGHGGDIRTLLGMGKGLKRERRKEGLAEVEGTSNGCYVDMACDEQHYIHNGSYSVKHFAPGRSNMKNGRMFLGQTEHSDRETRSKQYLRTQADKRKNQSIFSSGGRSLATSRVSKIEFSSLRLE